MISHLKNYFSFLPVILVLLTVLTQGAGILPDTQLLVVLLTFALAIFFFTFNLPVSLKSPHFSFGFLLLLLLLASAFSVWRTNSILTLLLIVSYWLIFLLVSNKPDAVKLKTLASALVLVGTVVSTWGVVNYAVVNRININRLLALGYKSEATQLMTMADRAFANFSSANSLAGFLGLITPVLIGLFISQQKAVLKFWLGLALTINIAAFYLTFSKGGLLSLTLSLILMAVGYLVLRWQSTKDKPTLESTGKRERLVGVSKTLTLGVAGLIFVFILYQFGFLTRFGFDYATVSAVTRLELWRAALKMIISRPLVGFGPGSFGTAMPQFQEGSVYSLFTHNTYLQFAAENGVLALLLLLITFVLILWLAWQNIKTASDKEKYLRLGILAALVSFIAHNVVDYTWYVPSVSLLFWLLAAVSVSGGFSAANAAEKTNQTLLTEKQFNSKISLKRWLTIAILALVLVPLIFAYIGTSLALQAEIKLSGFNYSEGRRLAQLAVKFFPFNAEAYDSLAKAYADPANPKKYIKEAIKAEKKAIKLRPTWPHYYARLADYLALANAPAPEVWHSYQKAIKLYPLEPQLKVKAGHQLYKLGEYQKAVVFYQQVVALSRIYQAGKQTASSLKTARSDVSIPVRAIGLAHLGLAKSYAYLGQFKKAQFNLKQAKRILGPVPGVFFAEGLIAEKQNKLEAAVELYQQAKKKSLFIIPEQNYRLALVYFKLGQKEKAVGELKKIVHSEASYAPAHNLYKKLTGKGIRNGGH